MTVNSAVVKRLVLLWIVSSAVRFALGSLVPAPIIFTDELTYWQMARSFHESGEFKVFGALFDIPTVLYSIFISPVFVSSSMGNAYWLAKALGALMMCAVVFPAYALAREILDTRNAFAAAVLSVAIPGVCYTSTVMAENPFYPTFVLCFWLCFRVLVRFRARDAILAGVITSAAFFVKIQAAILLAGFLLALLLLVGYQIVHVSRASLRVLRQVMALGLGICAIFITIAWIVRGRGSFMGSTYSAILRFDSLIPPLGATGTALIITTVAMIAGTGGIMLALVGSTKIDWSSPFSEPKSAMTTFGSCVAILFFGVVVRHTVLIDGSLRAHERYLFVLAPILFILWLARDKLVPPFELAIQFIVGAGLIVAASFYGWNRILTFNTPTDSPSLSYVFYIFLMHTMSNFGIGVLLFVLITLMILIGAWQRKHPMMAVSSLLIIFVILNLGWYHLQSKIIRPEVAGFSTFAEELHRELRPESTVAFLSDSLDIRVVWYSTFWLPNPTLTVAIDTTPPWWGHKVSRDLLTGEIEFIGPRPALIVAANTIKLPYPVVFENPVAGVRAYRITVVPQSKPQ